ncbi:hypothetical protein BDW02DRAFT_333938 [Decorospora gaudefroyi]|uniref:Uncharacterized protein n=1 Tax=Decorospora gaudefroyi TaxID=184978 RepID=A0A6A5KFQ9_9PLEO|nr:hypothetical protein BDW02DRAFT_333938 [Decorospora gaudefroyi]
MHLHAPQRQSSSHRRQRRRRHQPAHRLGRSNEDPLRCEWNMKQSLGPVIKEGQPSQRLRQHVNREPWMPSRGLVLSTPHRFLARVVRFAGSCCIHSTSRSLGCLLVASPVFPLLLASASNEGWEKWQPLKIRCLVPFSASLARNSPPTPGAAPPS